MADWASQGCERCRQSALRGGTADVLPLVNLSAGPTILRRCVSCRAYWLETQREMHVITEEVARTEFPNPLATILILEDDPSRMDRFHAALRLIAPGSQVLVWRSAKQMIKEVEPFLASARLISLDHDLYPVPGDPADPGDGLEIAKYLAPLKPGCPIIIHSSNAERRRMMAGEFELEGIEARIVAPLGEDWIEAYWAEVVRSMLNLT